MLIRALLRWRLSRTRYDRLHRNDDGTFRPLILCRYKNKGKIPRASPSAPSDGSDRETAIVTVDDSNDLQILPARGSPARLDLARNQANGTSSSRAQPSQLFRIRSLEKLNWLAVPRDDARYRLRSDLLAGVSAANETKFFNKKREEYGERDAASPNNQNATDRYL